MLSGNGRLWVQANFLVYLVFIFNLYFKRNVSFSCRADLFKVLFLHFSLFCFLSCLVVVVVKWLMGMFGLGHQGQHV